MDSYKLNVLNLTGLTGVFIILMTTFISAQTGGGQQSPGFSGCFVDSHCSAGQICQYNSQGEGYCLVVTGNSCESSSECGNGGICTGAVPQYSIHGSCTSPVPEFPSITAILLASSAAVIGYFFLIRKKE